MRPHSAEHDRDRLGSGRSSGGSSSSLPEHVAKLLGILSACQLNNFFRDSSQPSPVVNGHQDDIYRRKSFGDQKACQLVKTVMESLKQGSGAWGNLRPVVDSTVQELCAELKEVEWITVALTFYKRASNASSWSKELLPLTKVKAAMFSSKQLEGSCRRAVSAEDLQINLALSVIKAGTFLEVINASGELSNIVNYEANRRCMHSYKHELLLALKNLYKTGLFEELDTFWLKESQEPFRVPFPRNTGFRGRDAILRQVAVMLHESKQVAGKPNAVCIVGLEGVGKTSLALEYLYRNLADYEGVVWVDATPACVQEQYLSLTHCLQLQPDCRSSLHQRLKQVRGALEDGRKFLLVFDNVETEASLSALVPRAEDANNTHVIITSRYKPENLPCVMMTGVGKEEALQILDPFPDITSHPSPQTTSLLLRLSHHLDFLPLSLHMAATHLSGGKAPQDLITAITPQGEGTIAFDRTFQTPSSMRSLLDASMDRLKGRVGALATAILEVAAWFAPGLPIPLPQLVVAAQLLRGQDIEIAVDSESAVSVLVTRGLAKRERLFKGIVFHAVIHDYGQLSRPNRTAARAAVLATLTGSLCCLETAPHFYTMWCLRKDLTGRAEILEQIQTMGLRLARHYYGMGKLRDCTAILDEVLERRWGALSVEIRLRVRLLKVRALVDLGGETDLYTAELKLCVRESGKESLQTPAGLGLQIELLRYDALYSNSGVLPQASPSPRGFRKVLGASGKHVVFKPWKTAEIRALAEQLSQQVTLRDGGGPLLDYKKVNESHVMVGESLISLADFVRVGKEVGKEGYLGMLHAGLEVFQKVLPHTCNEISELLLYVGKAYAEVRTRTDTQRVIQQAFRGGVGRDGRDGMEEVGEAGVLANLHFTHAQRIAACQVYEKFLAQAESGRTSNVLQESVMMADLSLTMHGALTQDLLERSRYSLEAVVGEERGEGKRGERAPLSPLAHWMESCPEDPEPSCLLPAYVAHLTRQTLVRACQLRLGLVRFRLEGRRALGEAVRWIERSMEEEGEGEGEGVGVGVGDHLTLAGVMLQGGSLEAARTQISSVLRMGLGDGKGGGGGQAHVLMGAVEWVGGMGGDNCREHLEAGLRQLEEGLGGRHPEVADCLDCLGKVQLGQGLFDEAISSYQQSLSIREEVFGASHPALACNFADLAAVEDMKGRREKANILFERVAVLLEKSAETDILQLKERVKTRLAKESTREREA